MSTTTIGISLPKPKNAVEAMLFQPDRVMKFASIIGNDRQTERFLVAAATEIFSDSAAAACTPESIFMALMDAASLRLSASKVLGHVYFIPYKGVLTFQLGYKGMIALALRDPNVRSFTADVAHEGDEFDFAEGTNGFVKLKKAPSGRKKKPKTYGFSAIEYVGGGTNVRVMPWDEIEDVRNMSNAWKSGSPKARAFWNDHPDAMGAKTVIRSHAKFLSLGNDFDRGVTLDLERYISLDRNISTAPSFTRSLTEALTEATDDNV